MGKLVPYQLPAASLTPSERLRIEREIYRLIGLLDAVDGDADFEDGGDFEPSLSAYARFLPGVGLIEDCELDECDRESTGVTVPVGAYHI